VAWAHISCTGLSHPSTNSQPYTGQDKAEYPWRLSSTWALESDSIPVACTSTSTVVAHRTLRSKHWYMTKVYVRNKGISCSSQQIDFAPKFSMFCSIHTSFCIIILFCL
jgi:hypothetical protein